MTKIIDEPETENWSNIRLNVERSNCSLSFGTWALSSGLVGGLSYPFLVNRYLSKYVGFETRYLVIGFLTISTIFGVGYIAKWKCEENVIQLFAEGRRNELAKTKKI